MKALSVRAPWSWLIIHAGKDIENRRWPSKPRGCIAIHTSQTFDMQGYLWVREHFPQIEMPAPEEFLRGGIIGTVEHCGSVDAHESPWFEGPYGHVLKDPRPCRFLACPGRLLFFDVPGRLMY